MPPVIIPEEFNNFSMAEAFRFYRDAGLHVYPVHPPWAKTAYPGKQPAIKQWWDFDPQDCDIAKYFDNGRPYNIGVAPKNGLLVLDLDSKPDQGASVRAYLDQADEQSRNVPRHLTSGGAHLVMFCPDLPPWKNPKNGQPIQKPLSAKLNDKVSAELYHCERLNVVLPPSIHPSGFRYVWTLFGLLPEYIWCLLQRMIPFEEPFAEQPKERGRPKAWCTKFRGDLSSLDLIGLLASLDHGAELDDADEGRYTVKCPWRDTDHSDPADTTGAKVWQTPEAAPQFYCHHNCCRSTDRGLKEVLEWAEEKSPGIVDKFCALERVWRTGQKSRQGLPRVLHAVGRLESTVYSEVGAILGPHHAWYVRGSSINIIEQIPSGFVYSEDPSARYKIAAHSVGFRELSSLQAKGSLEKFMEPGVLVEDSSGTKVFVPKSFNTDFCAGMLVSDQLKEKLPHIARIRTVPLPFRVGQKLVYPKKGYDPRFATYLLPNAPELFWMPIEQARATIDSIPVGFCFTAEQSKTHAIARILTPFGRGILGWTTRVPLWFFWANRPRAGKDYLAAVALLIYEGTSFEDLPIGKDSEETSKRIMSAARNGRRFMHFSNCQAYLQDEYLIQALTSPVIAGRRLGSNEATSDLSVPNEMEFSLSGNIGLDYRDDLEPRMRVIELAFFEEDANSRVFPDKFLHRTIKNNRAVILSAIAAIYGEYARAGFPEGTTPFSTYPEWGSLVGGVMQVNGYGDPCQPFKGKFNDSTGDNKSRAMTELFKVCFEEFPGQKVKKTELYHHVHSGGAENDALGWFCPLEEITMETNRDQIHKNRTRLGKLLLEFEGRVLNGIKLIIDKSSGHPSRYTYQFVKVGHASGRSAIGLDASEASEHHFGSKPPENAVFAPSSCHPVTLKKGGDREGDNPPDQLPEPIGGQNCHPVTQNPAYAYAEEKNLSNTFNIKEDLFPIYGADPPEGDKGDRVTGCFLALDLETCAEVKVSRRGKPKIVTTKEALSPWKGEIRLVTVADGAGNIQSFDLRTDTLPDDTIKGLRKAIGADGRIHARFSPTGALSGRFASKGPNLQNITRGALRSCFIPSGEHRRLIVADYSQIELRIGAYFASDQVMLAAFRAKEDLHRATAAAVLSKPLAQVTKADRQLAKAVNFGFLYGQQAKGFLSYAHTNYGIVLNLEEATQLRDRFFARYTGLAKWHREAWEKAQQGVSEARTIFGRLLLEQGEGRDWDRFQLHTSYRVSGSAADVLKLGMVKTAAALPKDVHMVATVHDELVFDAPSVLAPQHSEMIRALMEEAFKELFGPELPIEAEVKVCVNWGEK